MVKEGIFVGPQIRCMIADQQFEELLVERERNAWISFKSIVANFLGINKSGNYQTIVKTCINSY